MYALSVLNAQHTENVDGDGQRGNPGPVYALKKKHKIVNHHLQRIACAIVWSRTWVAYHPQRLQVGNLAKTGIPVG